MKHDARCDRSWEAEAIAEGRISDVDRASFERHVASCGVCARERAQSIRLDRLLTALPNADADSMRRQRLRRRILSSVGTEAGTRWRWALLPFAAVLACVALYLLRPSAPNHPVVAVAPPVRSAVTYEITDVRDGAWSEAPIDSGVEVRLTSGEVQFHVHKLEPAQRFVVTLPDGDIEVRGTRFTVLVTNGRTRAVRVTEGVVAVRLRGESRSLAAGESWNVGDDAERVTPGFTATVNPAPPIVAQHASPPLVPSSAAPTVASRTDDGSPPPSDDFVLGMRAFRRGAYDEADRLFERFAARAVGDARVEDADYLRAVAHGRMGDRAGAAKLARAYLDAFPAGLRRREAEQLTSP